MISKKIVSPKEFLKSRRPNQFSDTITSDVETIDRIKLEYHLETLGARNQDKDFEDFAKRLSELKICPNLLPNTGPDAGGDGGADTQTFPVSEKTELGFYIGIPKKSSTERWAFSMSIEKDWSGKVRRDVEKLVGKKRGYKVIYCLTSRYAKASTRSNLEDELTKLHKVKIYILDRTWLLDTVFKDKYQNIAIETLKIHVEKHEEELEGINDIQRTRNLEKLNKSITEAVGADTVTEEIVEDALYSAIILRELERPRHELDGAHERAIKLAQEYGSEYSAMEANYDYAWSTFWWLEDYDKFKKLYVKVENLILKEENSFAIERLFNLWNLLATIRHQDKKKISKKFYETHTDELRRKLDELSVDTTKISGPLYARTMLILMELRESESPDNQLKQLTQIVKDSENLIGFPMKFIIEFVTESGDIFAEYPSYKELFETVSKVAEKRDGEITAAKLNLVRASKLLEAKKYYEVIEVLGPVLIKFQKKEIKDEAIRAYYFLGIAYRKAGLLWAARGSFLAGSSLAANDLWNHGSISIYLLACSEEIKWIELKLGRIAHMLEWHQLDNVARGVLLSKGIVDEVALNENVMPFDIAFGTALLRAPYPELMRLAKPPDRLNKLNFAMADDASKYALGQKEELSKGFMNSFPTLEERDKFIQDWGSLYDQQVHPSLLVDEDGEKMTLTTKILGCTIDAEADNNEACVEIAETLLATLESFLATGMLHRIAVTEEFCKINVTQTDNEGRSVQYSVDDEGSVLTLNVTVDKDFNPHKIEQSLQAEIRKTLDYASLMLTGHLIFISKENQLEDLIKNSSIRTIFIGSLVQLGNTLGYTPKHTLSAWTKKDKEYSVQRDADYIGIDKIHANMQQPDSEKKDKEFQDINHGEINMSSVIRNNLWDKAKWIGAAYSGFENAPPVIGLIFTEKEYGDKIFEAWRERFGEKDMDDDVRITIAKGIDTSHPNHYRMGIRSNVEKHEKQRETRQGVISRIHTMQAENSTNLDRFLEDYEKYGCYWIVPVFYSEATKIPEFNKDLSIFKRELFIRNAWEIGENDLDRSLVLADDKIIIPQKHSTDAPVLGLIENKNK